MTEAQTRITNEMLDQSRDELYNAVWGLVEAIRQQRNSAEEQEELSRAIIENDNLTFLYGKQVAIQELEDKREIPECIAEHEWIGTPLYCSACGVDKGEESN